MQACKKTLTIEVVVWRGVVEAPILYFIPPQILGAINPLGIVNLLAQGIYIGWSFSQVY